MGRIVGLDGEVIGGRERQVVTAQVGDLEAWARKCEERMQLSQAVRRAQRMCMADGLFYLDQRAPFISGDVAAVTLATTIKALYPPSNFPVLGGQYFSFIGKAILIRMFGRMTTVLTPGNGVWDVRYGAGTDNTGVQLAASGAVALAASGTNLSWWAEFVVRCRTLGSAGTLFCTGIAHYNVGLMASTNQPHCTPASAPVASAACDLTAANIISVQYSRSGSTAETMQVHELAVIALN